MNLTRMTSACYLTMAFQHRLGSKMHLKTRNGHQEAEKDAGKGSVGPLDHMIATTNHTALKRFTQHMCTECARSSWARTFTDSEDLS